MVPVMVAETDAGRRPRPGRTIDRLVGQRLEYVGLGDAIALSFSGDCQVFIESVAHLSGPAGRAAVEPGDTSDAFVAVLGETVRTARIRDGGELEIVFGGGWEVVVGVDPDFESWAVAGPDRFLVVCLARGEVASWGGA